MREVTLSRKTNVLIVTIVGMVFGFIGGAVLGWALVATGQAVVPPGQHPLWLTVGIVFMSFEGARDYKKAIKDES